ncbi:uncharacterized protein SCHCODRAFT_02513342 [Schizophyllum commune H4-8]|uniref:uncharacterized protein n=1 Tax=Schizophyllum commune (strain H4-8 / FGSC 9210) TaxID=578458 RepID=UPI0021603AF8|nr:uncharacterized protein SCHCODRAFT_02513342 [Schizophyllum commune H4-8]KAI5888352.1 hypothetical protein SCHCODRAFT_02513342 [Schizophyllum commune H4-8]
MLDLRNVKTKRPTKKLDYKRLGPFPIEKQVGTHAYRLKLPPGLSRLHPVFHVSLLHAIPEDTFAKRPPQKAPPVEVDEEGYEQWEVGNILDCKLFTYGRTKKIKYLVDWKGFGPEARTWEPVEGLMNAPKKIDEFHKKHPDKPRTVEGWEALKGKTKKKGKRPTRK